MKYELMFSYMVAGMIFFAAMTVITLVAVFLHRDTNGYNSLETAKRAEEAREFKVRKTIEIERIQQAALPEGKKGFESVHVEVERD